MAWHRLLLCLTAVICIQLHTVSAENCTSFPGPSPCTVTFYPPAVAQTGPTTTLYGAIVTEQLNVVACSYCDVTNVEMNPIAQGPFSTKCTQSTLTKTRLGCMVDVVATTRGVDPVETGSALPLQAMQLAEVAKRVVASEHQLASELAATVDPGNWTVVQAIQTYQKQCYSALVAVSLLVSSADLPLLCNLTKGPDTQLSLANKGLDGQQISNLICFWSVYGYSFSTSIFEVMQRLATTATSFMYAMQYGLNSTEDVTRLCGSLQLDDPMYEMLHIDSQGISTVLCSGAVSTTSSNNSTSTITSLSSETMSASSGNWSSWRGNGSDFASGTGFATGTAASTSFSSGWGANGSVVMSGTAWSSGAGFTFNSSATSISLSAGWGFNATGLGSGSGPTASAGWGFNATGLGSGNGPTASVGISSSNGTIVVAGSGATGASGTTFSTVTGSNGSVIASGPAGGSIWMNTTASGDGQVTASGVDTTASAGRASGNASGSASGGASGGASGSGQGFGPGSINITTAPMPSLSIPSFEVPTLSWTTFTDNGSVVVAGTGVAATTVASSFAVTLANGTGVVTGSGGVSGGAWSSAGVSGSWSPARVNGSMTDAAGFNVSATDSSPAGVNASSNGSTGFNASASGWSWSGTNASASSGEADVTSYSGLIWTSWNVSGTRTVAIITGTSSVSWGTDTATASITGSGSTATFKIIIVHKTIYVFATGIGQTWSVSGTGGDAIIGTGTRGTWTLESGSMFANGSSGAATGSMVTGGQANGTAVTGDGSGATASTMNPLAPGGVPGAFNITATGIWNFTSTVVGAATTSVSGNPSSVVKITATTTGRANSTTTLAGVAIPFGTGAVTTNSANITFTPISMNATNGADPPGEANQTFSIPPWTSSKFSYPDWATATKTSNSSSLQPV